MSASDPARGRLTAGDLARLKRSSAHSAEQITNELVAIRPRDRDAEIPLSAGQRQIWYLSEFAAGSNVYNEAATIRRVGPLDVGALERSLFGVIIRHEAWRTTFTRVKGEPRQIVHEPCEIHLPVLDLRALPVAAREAEAVRMATEDVRHPFNHQTGPLWRARLVRLGEEDWRLYLTMRHIIFDGVALYRVLLPELIALYEAEVEGRSSPLPPLPFQYADYAIWQQRTLESGAWSRQVAFWRERLEGVEPTELPTDRPRPPRQTFHGAMRRVAVSRELTDALRFVGQRNGATIFMTAAAAFLVQLHGLTGQTDLAIGAISSGRRRAGLESLLGYFLNTVVLRCDASGSPSFDAFLARVRGALLDALDNDEVPFATLVRELAPQRDSSRNPLFQILFSLEPPLPLLPNGWDLRQMDVDSGTSKFDLYVELDERPEGLIGRFIYSTDLFDEATVDRMADQWLRLLEAIVRSPGAPIDSHPLVAPEELALVAAGPERRPYPDRTLHELIADQASRTPDRVAVVSGALQLTYGEVDARANQLAHLLRSRGVVRGSLVGVCLPRTVDLVVALLAVTKAGAAYVPLDPDFPAARLSFMAGDAGLTAIVTTTGLRTSAGWPPALAQVCIERDREQIAACSVDDPCAGAEPVDRAYVLYTSGSTGHPKGVAVGHRSLVNLLWSMRDRPGLDASDTLLAVTTISFDIAALELFLPLVVGGRVVLSTREEVLDGRALETLLRRSGATAMQATPSVWDLLIRSGWSGDSKLKVLCGGEPLSRDLAAALLHRCGTLWNCYGPTETTIWSTCARIIDAGEQPSLGDPVANTRLLIVDTRGRPVPPGVLGELYIGGDGVSFGYVGKPELTAQRFVPDPLGTDATFYRTGDLVRRTADGRLQFLGRLDDQLKIRGHRIEPGEIEHLLAAQPGVGRAVVVPRGGADGVQLVAYLAGDGEVASAGDMRRALRAQLPEYMLPQAFVVLDALPTTPNGKVDRAALPVPEVIVAAPPVADEPDGRIERELRSIWERLLGHGSISLHDGFFDLGGHSLLAVQMLADVEAASGVRPSISRFLADPTIAGLAEGLRDEMEEQRGPIVVGIREEEVRLPTAFVVFSDEPTLLSLRHLGAELDDYRLWGLLPGRRGRRFDRMTSVEAIARKLRPLVEARQPTGPITLLGHSFGGLLAYELACQLEASGRTIALVAQLDGGTPHVMKRGQSALTGWRSRWRRFCQGELLDITRNGIRRVSTRVRPERPSAVPSVAGQQTAILDDFDYDGAMALTRRYRLRHYSGPLLVLVTKSSVELTGAGALGWDKDPQGPLLVRQVPGAHGTMLLPPNIAALAQEIRTAAAWAALAVPPADGAPSAALRKAPADDTVIATQRSTGGHARSMHLGPSPRRTEQVPVTMNSDAGARINE